MDVTIRRWQSSLPGAAESHVNQIIEAFEQFPG
jgi:hypothetical protein